MAPGIPQFSPDASAGTVALSYHVAVLSSDIIIGKHGVPEAFLVYIHHGPIPMRESMAFGFAPAKPRLDAIADGSPLLAAREDAVE